LRHLGIMIGISSKYRASMLALVAASLSTGCSAPAAPGLEATADACVQRVLAADDVLGSSRNFAPELAPIHEAVRAYADALEDLDYAGCPTAFVEAYRAHVAAWRASMPLLRRHAARRGEMHELFKAIANDPEGQDLPAYEAVIWKTWAEVERAAQD
jgi:hypothetical protein